MASYGFKKNVMACPGPQYMQRLIIQRFSIKKHVSDCFSIFPTTISYLALSFIDPRVLMSMVTVWTNFNNQFLPGGT